MYREYTSDENPDNNLAFNNMALCYFKLSEYELALEACDEAIALDEEYPKAYCRRIMIRREMVEKNLSSDPCVGYKIFQDCQTFTKVCDPLKDAR